MAAELKIERRQRRVGRAFLRLDTFRRGPLRLRAFRISDRAGLRRGHVGHHLQCRTRLGLAGRPRDEFALSTKVGRLLVPVDAITPDMDVDRQAPSGVVGQESSRLVALSDADQFLAQLRHAVGIKGS